MDIIKCDKCGNVLMSGSGCVAILGAGIKIGCRNCENSITLKQTTIVAAKETPKVLENK